MPATGTKAASLTLFLGESRHRNTPLGYFMHQDLTSLANCSSQRHQFAVFLDEYDLLILNPHQHLLFILGSYLFPINILYLIIMTHKFKH